MFISEEEGNERLRDPRNVLNRVSRGDRPDAPPELPDLVLPDLTAIIPASTQKESQNQPQPDLIDPLIDFPKTANYDPFAALKLAQLIDSETPGRKNGIRNRTDQENASVAVVSMLLGPGETEKMFGVSQSQQHMLKDGVTSPQAHAALENGGKVRVALLEEIHRQSGHVIDKTFGRLDKVLNALTDEKIAGIKSATDVARVATGMSRIIRDLTPKEVEERERTAHFHVYVPEQQKLSDYETIVVGAGRSDAAIAGAASASGNGTGNRDSASAPEKG